MALPLIRAVLTVCVDKKEAVSRLNQPRRVRQGLARAFDTVACTHLVRAQLEWRLLPDKPDKPCKVLDKLGPETFSPCTDRPFQWAAENRRLWFVTVARGGKLSAYALQD